MRMMFMLESRWVSSDRECFIAWWSSSSCGLPSTSPHTLQGNTRLQQLLWRENSTEVALRERTESGGMNSDDGVDSTTDTEGCSASLIQLEGTMVNMTYGSHVLGLCNRIF